MAASMAMVEQPEEGASFPPSIFDEGVYDHISEVPGFENATDFERLVLIDRFFLVATQWLPYVITLGGVVTFAFSRHADNDRGEETTEAQREDHT